MDLKQMRDALEAAATDMEAAADLMAEAGDEDEATDARAKFDAAQAEYRRLDGAIEAHQAVVEARAKIPAVPEPAPAAEARGEVRVGKEPLTYQKGGPNSFMRDMMMAAHPSDPDQAARERLARHRREAEVELRDMTTTDTTSVGEMIPPLWAVDMYAPIARAGRPLANNIGSMDLPRGTDVVIIPRVTTGGSVHFQTAENTTIAEQDMVTGGTVQAQVRTVAGQLDFSLQSVEWGPMNMIDQFALPELFSLHANRIETTVGTGTGASGQFSGIIGTSGTQNVTYTSATPTAGSLYSAVANAIQQVHTNRFLPPDLIVMHPRRWGWLLAQSDTTGRPLVVPSPQGPFNAAGQFGGVQSEGIVGSMQGLPVLVTSAAIPTNDAAGTTNDVVLVVRRDNLMLWESPIRTRVLYEVLSGALSVRVQLYNYATFTAGRYPTAISAVRGTGLSTPSF